MYKILYKQVLSEGVKLMVVDAPRVARKAKAGQFVIVRASEEGERIPLTIADYDRETGSITLVIREVGVSTMKMGALEVGQEFATVAGPLGHPSELANYGTVVCVGGGVGIAALAPIACALQEMGNEVISIIGARTRDLLFWEERMREFSRELIVTTDDGSYGRKGLVTEPLKDLLETRKDIARIWAIGPAIMMKAVSQTSRPFAVPTIVSLNTIMIDGTGMCGGCRVLLDGESKFVCMDGPEFDAHIVNWDVLLSRLSFYREEEKLALDRWQHTCQSEATLSVEAS